MFKMFQFIMSHDKIWFVLKLCFCWQLPSQTLPLFIFASNCFDFDYFLNEAFWMQTLHFADTACSRRIEKEIEVL